jgi:hypothetical protein
MPTKKTLAALGYYHGNYYNNSVAIVKCNKIFTVVYL